DAVREVEQALLRLDAADRRLDDTRRAAQGYREFLAAATSQWEVGAISLLDLEQARRNAQDASAALLQTQRERIGAWLALYKAVGGGWQAGQPGPTASIRPHPEDR
ncbi:MAG TPA: TolC family protein, partial [Zeimonas sp.]